MVIAADDPRLAKIGFFKLLGEGLEFYAKKYTIILGRESKSAEMDVVLGMKGLLAICSRSLPVNL